MAKDTDQQVGRRHGASALWFAQCSGLLLLVWMALNGLNGLVLGLATALLAAAAGTYFAGGQPYPWQPLRWLAFAGFFLLESIKGGSDVAWRALHPAVKIEPVFQPYEIKLPSGLPTTLLTSLVSLLPGTLSVRLHEHRHVLNVHALTPSAVASVERLERMLSWVFRAAEKRL